MGKGQGSEKEMMSRATLPARELPQGSVDALEATETL
jgi:hypothetical protein